MSVDPVLARAATLPSRAYLDPGTLAVERERVLGTTWQWAAAAGDLAAPGDVVPVDIAGEPVVLVRDDDGTLRALSNVCRHRAGAVVARCGNARSLTCTYHGWRYRLDGTLASAREVGEPEGFDAGSVRLPGFAVDTWGGFAFVDLSGDAPPLADVLGEIATEAGDAVASAAGLPLVAERTDVIACNWKTYVDNYLEGYHIPFVHPSLHRLLDTAAYRVEPRRWHSRQFAPLRDGDDAVLYYWVFPNLMLNLYPGNVQVNVVTPLDAERTRTWFGWYAADPADVGEAVAFAAEVQEEDIAVCEAVQRGLRSRTYDRGRYSTRHEAGVHHFHRLWSEAMGEG